MRLELINLFKVAVIVGVGAGLGAALIFFRQFKSNISSQTKPPIAPQDSGVWVIFTPDKILSVYRRDKASFSKYVEFPKMQTSI
jgi:hypothetical protein